MSTMDLIIVIVVGLSCLFGLWRGFVREILALLSWVVAILVASLYSPHLAPSFEVLIGNATARYALSFFLLCLVVLLLGGLINHFMVKLIQAAGLGLSDRLLGAGFGVVRGVIVVTVVVFFLSTAYSGEPWWERSQLAPHAMRLAEWSQLFIDDVTGGPDPAPPAQDGVN